MKLGLVGYGLGGRVFHAPFIEAAEGVELVGVVARSPDKIAELARDLPGVAVYPSLSDMIAAGGIDMVTITTPPETHKPLVLEAIAAGRHVVCDKPFAPNLADSMDMVAAAKAKGVLLNVFHNRRWDTDFQTLKTVIDDGHLGKVQRAYNRMDLNEPGTVATGPGGGLLRDLGSHVLDQMLLLFGPALAVDAQMEYIDLPEGRTDASFAVHIQHASGTHSYSSASKINFCEGREFRIYGDKGTYVANGTDVQTRRIFNGDHPKDDRDGWAVEPEYAWGKLHTKDGTVTIPSVRSNISDLYTAFAAAARSGDIGPVPPVGALHTMRVLDAAREAAETGHTVDITD